MINLDDESGTISFDQLMNLIKDLDKSFMSNKKQLLQCDTFKEIVLSLLKHKDWIINNVEFSDNDNLESINIKFKSEFTLGNSPWDPRK